jgi:GTPase SAR1 family protein
MGRYAQLVVGPAGSGKSTYCENLRQHCETVGRRIHIANLDPAADAFNYPASIDIRDLVTLEDVMEQLELGPNGGLVACMEYLEENLDDWLGEELESSGDDDYIIFDCPGQIELYTNSNVFRAFTHYLQSNGWHVCAVYCLDSQFVTEANKFIAGSLQALAAMVQLEVPHISVLTKVDLLQDKDLLEDFLIPDPQHLSGLLAHGMPPRFQRLSEQMAGLVDEYSMVSFLPLDISEEDSIQDVLAQIDAAIQFGEDADVKVQEFDMPGDDM